jgi:hypothetical protein
VAVLLVVVLFAQIAPKIGEAIAIRYASDDRRDAKDRDGSSAG